MPTLSAEPATHKGGGFHGHTPCRTPARASSRRGSCQERDEMDGRLLIQATGITKTFPGVRALDRVDFELKAGETHILLGENGAGKSTLMKILSGAYAPDEGAVSIDGEPVEIFDPRVAQRMGVSIIYQEFNLIPYMNVAQNIYLGRFPVRR